MKITSNLLSILVILAQLIVLISGDPHHPKKYTNYSLVKVEIHDEHDANVTRELPKSVKIWLHPHVGDYAAILVPPSQHQEVLNILDENMLKYNITQKDIQKDIDHEKVVDMKSKKHLARLRKLIQHNLTWNSYHDQPEFESFYRYLEHKFGNIVKLKTIGKTHEGRDITLIKICSSGECGKKPTIMVEGGIHAREWVSPASTLWITDRIVHLIRDEKPLFKSVDWYIVPLLNPDGYAYSRTTDRLWRKNRSPNKDCPKEQNDKCYGVDLNRNFDFQWDHDKNHKDLLDIKSEAYHGPKPFSEKETSAMAKFIKKHKSHIKAFVTVHSFGQYILTPWGYTRTKPKNFPKLFKIIKKAVKSMEAKNGTHYKYLHALDLSKGELVTGTSMDWVVGKANIPLSFALELRDQGDHGFELPADQILNNSEEVMAFLTDLAKHVTKNEHRREIRLYLRRSHM